MDTITHTFYRWAIKQIRDGNERYESDVRNWYTHGDGRSVSKGGKGYRYPECRHGVSTWVDYDCACWRCESGDSDIMLAIWEANNLRQRYDDYAAAHRACVQARCGDRVISALIDEWFAFCDSHVVPRNRPNLP